MARGCHLQGFQAADKNGLTQLVCLKRMSYCLLNEFCIYLSRSCALLNALYPGWPVVNFLTPNQSTNISTIYACKGQGIVNTTNTRVLY
jgi:hypothetical protein